MCRLSSYHCWLRRSVERRSMGLTRRECLHDCTRISDLESIASFNPFIVCLCVVHIYATTHLSNGSCSWNSCLRLWWTGEILTFLTPPDDFIFIIIIDGLTSDPQIRTELETNMNQTFLTSYMIDEQKTEAIDRLHREVGGYEIDTMFLMWFFKTKDN